MLEIEQKIKEQGGIWINDGWVVEGNLNLFGFSFTALPKIKFVGGWFNCSFNRLTNLIGAPETVGGDFSCSYNELTSLINAPKMVGGDFDCWNNPLKSLSGLSDKIGGKFYCDNNLSFPKEEIMLLIKAHPKNLKEVVKIIKWI